MWLSDEEFVFRQDVREKKQAGRGVFCKVRGGGKHVRLPSDYLSRKERQKMNGECVTYNMNKPVNWQTAKKEWPNDILVQYFKKLYFEYGFSTKMIGKACNVSDVTLVRFAKANNIQLRPPRCRSNNDDIRKRFTEFVRSVDVETSEKILTDNADAAVLAVAENAMPEGKEPTAPQKVEVDRNNIAVLLAALAGTGAKLTIEVTL